MRFEPHSSTESVDDSHRQHFRIPCPPHASFHALFLALVDVEDVKIIEDVEITVSQTAGFFILRRLFSYSDLFVALLKSMM